MKAQDNILQAIWKQEEIPVIFRQADGKPLLVKLPYAKDNRAWLKERKRRKEPLWVKQFKCWQIPKSRFNDLTRRMLRRFHRVYIVQPYREQEKCAPACWNASGFDCECSCMGENHGAGNPLGKWFVVSETFAVRWHKREYACRLIDVDLSD